MEVKEYNRCCICGQIITEQYSWNPEIKKKENTNFYQFDPSKNLFCPHCYEKLKYTVRGESNENAAHKG